MPVWEYAKDNKTKRLSNRTLDAAHLIAVLAQICHINPKLLLVRMQMEENLVTGTCSLGRIEPDWLMTILGCGFGVGDGQQQTSNSAWSGLDKQLVLAAYFFREFFNNQDPDNHVPSDYPTSVAMDEGTVPVFNRATRVLYWYTPHTHTQDGQGNIAFVQTWRDFFGNGTLGSN